MDITIYTTSLAVFVCTFVLRSSPLFFIKEYKGTDRFSHLYYINVIRESKHHIPKKTDQILTSGFLGYPMLLHWILSFFDEGTVKKIEPYLGSLWDSLHATLLFISSIYIFSTIYDLNSAISMSLLACVIFVFTPAFMKPGARTFSISARPVGGLLVSISLITAILFTQIDNNIYALISIFSASLVFLSSKFSAQALFFISLGLGILTLNIFSFFIPILAFLLAIAISKGQYLTVLRGHIRYLHFYSKYIQFHHNRLLPVPLNTLFWDLINRTITIKDLLKEVGKRPTFRLLIFVPYLLVFFIGFYSVGFSKYPIINYLVFWAITPLFLFALFNNRYLKFLGEPDRYMEYGIFPISLYIAFVVASNQYLYYILAATILFSIGIIIFNTLVIVKFTSINEKLGIVKSELVEYLNSTSEIFRTLPIPLVLGKEIVYKTKHKAVVFMGNMGTSKESREEFKLLVPDEYPYISKELDKIIDYFKCNALIVDKEMAGNYDFSTYDKIFENDGYLVYRTY